MFWKNCQGVSKFFIRFFFMIHWMVNVNFYNLATPIFPILQVMLDDHILKAQTMHSSAYIKPFEEEMKEWEDKLISMQEHNNILMLLWCYYFNSAGHPWRLAQVPGELALPRAHLQLRGHHETDACRGTEVQQGKLFISPQEMKILTDCCFLPGWPDLEEHHGQDCVRHQSAAGHQSAQHAGETRFLFPVVFFIVFPFKIFFVIIICEWMRRKFVQFCTQLGSFFWVHYGLCYRYFPPQLRLGQVWEILTQTFPCHGWICGHPRDYDCDISLKLSSKRWGICKSCVFLFLLFVNCCIYPGY